ncbi:Protein-glutamate methylesterase/protein-glutamine glutaminase [Paenibacillus auburnensis]|uniref:Protein-glutamate methylesterase/protein-glutamine glutaminase n=1 Tax=Paenibacillus auburnensis TaxID=2905649 RepID=A0ABM9BPE9_9BACL|nr:response regulator [Paenibacillus auburnensis]CAH1191715.1 Protein-glutamate methylesterase/protein-glutamine glutaminase [Paenibacillus auburnensis]
MSINPVVLDKIRCIVVDDEALIRERFRYAFPLEEHGFEIVGEAEDGEEALELCRQLSPDIVITDVVMPRMNGLELTEQLKQQMPQVKVIILSSFQEFEFARKAVMLGALGYLLKVTSGYQELLDILVQARSEIEADREKMLLSIEERKHLQDSQPLLRKQLIHDIMSGAVQSISKLNSTCDFVNWHRPAPAYVLGMVSIDRFTALSRTFHAKDLSLFKYVMMRIIEELADGKLCCNVYDWELQSIGLWVQLSPSCGDQEELQLFYENILHHARKYLPFTVSVCISSTHRMDTIPQTWPASLSSAFGELEELRAALFYHGHGGLHICEAASGAGQENMLGAEPAAALNDHNSSLPELPDPVERLAGWSDPSQLQRLVHDAYIRPFTRMQLRPDELLRWMEELAVRWTTADADSRSRFRSELGGIETIFDAEEFLLRLFMWKQSAIQLSFDQPVQRSEIQKALDYVARHYREPVSVADISEYTAISPNYFSHLFKAQTGINFSDYVTRYRIEKSKQYLRETDKQVGEIAEQVGIPDYKYFARIFRRLVGKTPSQYREEEGLRTGKV